MTQPLAVLELRATVSGESKVFDLLNGASGFYLSDWRPKVASYKGGGVFQDSPIAGGRSLVYRQFETAVETFKLKLSANSQDGAIFEAQELRRLLELAADYSTSEWQNDPVYLVMQPRGATNEQYALIIHGRIPEDEAPFGTTFWQPLGGKSTWDLTLIVERGHWTNNTPGTGTAIGISAVEAYDGINYGNVDSDGNRETAGTGVIASRVFVANKRNVANITNHHIGAGGGNLIGTAPPYNSIGATGETYFGIDTSVDDSGPFCSLVFDIGTAGAGGPTLVWEYWQGSAWTTLTVKDNTLSFTLTGIRPVHWEQPGDWATTTPGGSLPTGYWVRVRVTSGSFSTQPTQQNRNVYTVVWPYIEIQESAVGGDIPALLGLRVWNWSGANSAGTAPLLSNNRIIAGLRSVSRGENFTAYLNFSDEQNPAGVTVASENARLTFAASSLGITGRVASYVAIEDPHGFTDVASITLDNAISQEYYGSYHIYLRAVGSGTAFGNLSFRLRVEIAPDIVLHRSESSSGAVTVGTFHQLIDFGRVTIGAPVLGGDDAAAAVAFYVEMANSSGSTVTALLHDLILIPVDEWSMNTYDPAGNATTVKNTGISGTGERLEVDGLSPKALTRSFVRNTSTLGITSIWRTATNGAPIVQANSRQRIWFLQSKYSYSTIEAEMANPWMVDSVQVLVNQRYLGMRGAR